jgi:hypothetical protein
LTTNQKIITEIDGYEVELQTYEGQRPATDVYIAKRTANRTYTAHLGALLNTGELEWNGYCHPVHPQTISEIERWALENGY